MSDHKRIMIFARRDMREAMRVASGMTIFGHRVRLAIVSVAPSPAEMANDEAELLELAEVETITTLPDLGDFARFLSAPSMVRDIAQSDMVISL